ncbi:uncharacterized protein [Chiloscyllium punctatum]|uniref:uncharacterized protein n=1 Tax=Chiloscyllium punctatum TaxID=137246 RepID=UPI003B63992A
MRRGREEGLRAGRSDNIEQLNPFREVPFGNERTAFVVQPLNSGDIRQLRNELPRLLDDPVSVGIQLDQFLGPSIYTWAELQAMMRILFNYDEIVKIRNSAMAIWDREHQDGPQRGEQKYPLEDPRWDHNDAGGRANMTDLRSLIIRGIQTCVPKQRNLAKAFEVGQKKDESPSRLKYLLVVVDHLTGWVEAFPTTTATATQVSKILLEQIIPRFGLPRAIDSDQGSHFTSTVLQNVVQAMGIDWDLHTPWHPSSSGKVERMNQTIKKQLTKLTSEIGLPWTKCQPLALLQIGTQPRRDLGVSPFEMLFGLPFHGPKGEPPVFESRDMFVQKYVVALGSALSRLRQQGLLAQTPPLEFAVHTVKPGQWVLIKCWKQRTLEPTWDGPFLVLLTTETAVHTAEKGWTHYTRVKGPVPQPTEDERTSLTKASKEQRL